MIKLLTYSEIVAQALGAALSFGGPVGLPTRIAKLRVQFGNLCAQIVKLRARIGNLCAEIAKLRARISTGFFFFFSLAPAGLRSFQTTSKPQTDFKTEENHNLANQL